MHTYIGPYGEVDLTPLNIAALCVRKSIHGLVCGANMFVLGRSLRPFDTFACGSRSGIADKEHNQKATASY